MKFVITPDDTEDRDRNGNVFQLSHNFGRFPTDALGITSQSPADLADEYVRTVGKYYGFENREMTSLGESITGDPKNEKSKLKRDSQKESLESIVITYQQTFRGLPVWNAYFNVIVSGTPPQVIASNSTVMRDVEIESSLRIPEIRNLAKSLIPETLEDVLGVSNDAGEDFSINSSRLIVYRFESDERYDRLAQVNDSTTASGWGAPTSTPFLQLPDVDSKIENGKYYIVREVLFSLILPDWGKLNWRAFVEAETNSVLYLRAFTASANCCVYLTDPITSTGRPLTAASPIADLNAARDCNEPLLGLDPPVAGQQTLSGEFVTLVDTDSPSLNPPTESNPFDFEYDANSNDFAAVNGYFHMDRIYRMVRDFGFDVNTYFDGTTFPIPVDHRGKNSQVNASANGNTAGNGMEKYLYGLVQAGQSVGIASSYRVCLHEFGHALLWDHVNWPNFGWAHSAGDTLAAILNDPGSNGPDRFQTFPFLAASTPFIDRRHDRDVANGWAWGGSEDDTQYGSEQILSTLMFRIYRVTGGDDNDENIQWFAARYLTYLILQSIRSLRSTTTNPEVYVNALMRSDQLNPDFEGHPGGAWHKLFRWSFEKQGLYQPPGAPRNVTTPGAPPPVDVYIDDGRDGDYWPYQTDIGNAPDVWNRIAADSGLTHQSPAIGMINHLYVRVKNRGTQTARDVIVRAYQSVPGTDFEWPTDWRPLTTPRLEAGSIASQGDVIIGPFEWTPTQLGNVNILASVSATGDTSNAETVNGPISNARLVPLDNNLAQRDMVAVNLPPVLENISDITVDENSQREIDLQATDIAGDPLTFSLSGPTFVTLTPIDDRTAKLTIQPGFEDSGTYLALVRVEDPLGAFDSQHITITVNNVNRSPVLENIDPIYVQEGGRLIRNVIASDPDRQSVLIKAHSLPPFAAFTDDGDGKGTLLLDPSFRDAGLYHSRLEVTDPEGASDRENFSIVVTNVLMPLATQIIERPFNHGKGIIELKVNNLQDNLASQVQVQIDSNWVNVMNENGDRSWYHEKIVANEVVRYTYGTNALNGLYRWVIYDELEGQDQGLAVSDTFSISEMGKHIVVEVTLSIP